MSATTIKQTEALPASYPDVTPYPHRPVENGGVTDAEIDPALVWQRIESYIAYRWSEREVVWIVEGSGDWTPPVSPATITETEVWRSEEHTSELQSLMRSSYAVFCLETKTQNIMRNLVDTHYKQSR